MKHGLLFGATGAAMLAVSGMVWADQWRLAGSIGMRQFVVVSPSMVSNAEQLKRTANHVCIPSQVCVVVFWREEQEGKQISKSQAPRRTVVAQYVNNPFTGNEGLQMKCRENEPRTSKCL